MPASRAQRRRAKIIAHTIDFGDGETVTFWFDRNKITDVWMDEWRETERETDAPKLNEMLADLIDRWDLYEDEEYTTLIPVTPGEVGKLFSLPDKALLMEELFTAARPSRAEGEASGPPSSLTPQAAPSDSTPPSPANPPTPPNGQAASGSLTPSASPSPT